MRVHRLSLFPSLFILLAITSLTWARLVNRTIDDFYGDSVTGLKLDYGSPTWQSGDTCKGCLYNDLDKSRVMNGTWRDVSAYAHDTDTHTLTVRFRGTAVYVYTILAAYWYYGDDGKLNKLTVTYLTFEIDGVDAGEFYIPDMRKTELTYQAPVLAHKGLSDGPHTLVIRIPPGPDRTELSYVLFEYTTTIPDSPVPSNPPPPSSPTPPSSQSPQTTASPPQANISTFQSSTTNRTDASLSPSSPNTTALLSPSIPPDHISWSSSTTDTNSSPSPSLSFEPSPDTATAISNTPIGAIAGGAVGGVALLAVLGFILYRRRKRLSRSHGGYPPKHIPSLPAMAGGVPSGRAELSDNSDVSAHFPSSTSLLRNSEKEPLQASSGPTSVYESDGFFPHVTSRPTTLLTTGPHASASQPGAAAAVTSSPDDARLRLLEQEMQTMRQLTDVLRQLVDTPPQYQARVGGA